MNRSYQDKLRILNEKQKNKFVDKLNSQFGIKEVPGIIVRKGQERIFFYSGNLTQGDLQRIEEKIPIERVGVYLAKAVTNRDGKEEIRLSLEGSQILGKLASKNIVELDEKQSETWMMGEEVLIETTFRGFVIIKHKENFIGCGKASEKKITNFISKSRRLKNKNIIG